MKIRVRSLSLWIPALIAFSAGALLGTLAGTLRHDRKIGFTSNATTVATQTKTTVELETSVDPVSAPPSPTGTPNDVVQEPPHLTRLDALSSLNEKLQRKISIPLLRSEDLNDDFVRLYELSNAETGRLRHALATASRKVSELQARQATIEKTSDDEFRIFIPDAPVEGGAIHDELVQSIRATLGPQRLRHYETLSRVDFEQSTLFNRFGLAQSEIVIRPFRDDIGQPSARHTTWPDRGDGVMVQTMEIDPTLFPTRFPWLHQKMIEAGLISATP